jgi:D-alanyl-D-alanine carboxypeptidase (penicillin-binding protein 5/6)
MKIKILMIVLLLLACAMPSYAATIETPATHATIIDAETGTVLLSKNADTRMPTSSMSKTMTLYIVFEALKDGHLHLTDELPVSERAWKMEGSRMFVKVGSKVKVEDLIRGVAIQSGNDATVTLAEGLAGTEDAFAERMNMRAKDLGMANSHFMNASGLPDPNHYSTPHDLALLASHLLKDFPEYYRYFSEKEFTYNKIHQPNRDPLLGKVVGADGIKTGHTDIAGYGLIGSAMRDGRRLILVANGFDSEKARAEEGAKLMEWGFRNFENKTLFKKGERVDAAQVWLGQESEVPLVADKDLTVVLPIDKRASMKLTVKYTGPLEAPVKKGVAVGKLHVEIPDQQPIDIELLTGSDVERKGLFGRVAARFQYLMGKT